jgi:pyruvate kinase
MSSCSGLIASCEPPCVGSVAHARPIHGLLLPRDPEKILWECEAPHVPVIWATQVLESLVKTGVPTQAELTDAAMAQPTERVMLNNGPHILDGVDAWRRDLPHGSASEQKTSRLRALRSW